MSEKVYKIFQSKPTEAWHQLSAQDQEKLLAKVSGALDAAGGKSIVTCDSYWSSEQWPFFGVEEFPSIQVAQKHSKLLIELNWTRYFDSQSSLGTELQKP